MKKFFLLALLFQFAAASVFAQDNSPKLSVGPYFSFKAGINGQNIEHGRKDGVSFYPVPDFGASAFYALLSDYSLAVSCDFGYSAYSYTLLNGSTNESYNFHFGYLTLSPNIFFYYFSLGITFGYPLHADFGTTIDTKTLNDLAELRLGFTYPVMFDDDVAMNVFVNAGYMLTGVYKDYAKDDPLQKLVPAEPLFPTTNLYNPRAISVSLGLNYLFSIK